MVTEEKERRFYLFRYLLAAQAGKRKPERALPTPKGAAALASLGIDSGERAFKKGDTEFLFVGFHPAEEFAAVPVDRRGLLFIGKLAKHRVLELGQHVPGDIVSTEADDWRRAWMVIDARNQYVAVEAGTQVGAAESLKNVLAAGLGGPVLQQYGHRVTVTMVADPGLFWQVVAESTSLLSIAFELQRPNPDNLDQDVEDLLRKVNGVTNQETVRIAFENPDGQLKADRTFFGKLLAYTDPGGGRWRVRRIRNGENKASDISSSDNAQVSVAKVPVTHEADPAQPDRPREVEIDPEKHALAAILSSIARQPKAQ